MAAQVRTVDFLPEIFQTPVNKQFLAATLDQLVQEPKFKIAQGYIGRRVGPGVGSTDTYIVEPTANRQNYQLEPGVVSIDPTTTRVEDAITYPGILDALQMQGAYTNNPTRLFESEYYSWDPFVDFDKYINYSQYYWVPEGPLEVDVYSTLVPETDSITVTRANGAYTFTGYEGENPTITLVRNGSYQFQVAQQDTATETFRVTNRGQSAWIIDYIANPTLTLTRGNTYVFNLSGPDDFQFYIKTAETFGTTDIYNNGVINNGGRSGLVTFTVPQDAPDTLYYVNPLEFNLRGTINITDAEPGTGPGFWIQTAPGVDGRLPTSPNINDREVLGVVNNGLDLGTVTFNVPSATAQNFYTSMPPAFPAPQANTVDLIVPPTLDFDQINGIPVEEFFAANPTGIDGVTNLNGRTLIFSTQVNDIEQGGWYRNVPFDSLTNPSILSINVVVGNSYQITAVGSTNWNTVAGTSAVTYAAGDVITAVATAGGDGTAVNIPTETLVGAYDTTVYSSIPVDDPTIQFGVWQITYANNLSGVPCLYLTSVASIDELTQFTIAYGEQYVNTAWYKDVNGFFQQQPLITAPLTTLYYQDGTDPEIFGTIQLIDDTDAAAINVLTDILGQKTYTSPNGVTFTNGLKVNFLGDVIPASYAYAEANGYPSYYVNGVGSSITLTPASELVTPEPYIRTVSISYDATPYDSVPYDQSVAAPLVPDYMTINMASLDRNPWSRGNRWFHIDVINAAAAYNKTAPDFTNAQRAKRPILEFRSGLRLFNFGTSGLPAIDVIDFTQTDALSNVNGSEGYGVDGYFLQENSLVVFAADLDPDVRKTVYQVKFIVPAPEISTTPIIDLVPTNYSPVLTNQTTICTTGNTLQGKTFTYDGVTWIESQQKTQNNQPPLFDVYNSSGISFGNKAYYPSSNFTGCKLLSYAEDAANSIDTVLGIPLKYFSLNNIGDIIFDNNLYTDTFIYTENNTGVTVNVSSGFVREYTDRITYTREIGWQTGVTPSFQRQQFKFIYDGTPLQLDIAVQTSTIIPTVQVYINNVYQTPNTFVVEIDTTTNTTSIRLTGSGYVAGDVIEVLALSDQTSSQGFYEIPDNLENNPFNANSPDFTLGTARSHYGTICENLLSLQGPINGPNNTRDLGNIVPYGQQILQQASPMTLAGYFLRSAQYNIFSSLEFNSREYIKYKNKLLSTVTNLDITTGMTVPEILDTAILQMNANKTSSAPFYWSDMLPTGTNYTSNSTTVTPITTSTFNTIQTYDFTTSNYLGLLVYLNGELLVRGTQYVVSTESPRLTILVPLSVGDVVTINEYSNTAGNFAPNTPSKMGLYQKYLPEIFVDTTYTNADGTPAPTLVIRGHDGSITIAFTEYQDWLATDTYDLRDMALLEYEKRVYNNIKVDNNPIPLSTDEVTPNFFPEQTSSLLPGFFRTTPYTYAEVNNLLNESFLSWVGQNNVDYTAQNYQPSNEFSYNYSDAGNLINKEQLPQGAWRGIYRYFYDTETPDTTPWQMLGFSEMPAWWESRYGPAPYTSGNLVLWDDLEAGLVADPANPYILVEYARPGLTSIIPTDSEGALLSPLNSLVGNYDPNTFKQSWKAGDGGPTQASWWKSSSYPFAIMRMLALTKPAEFFSLYADRDLYRYNTELGQYLYNGRYRLDASGIQIYGNGTSKASYINWIVDYNRQQGLNSTDLLARDLGNLDVRLCYRMASFTDQNYLSVFTERSGPESTNNSLLLPPESYNLLFYRNQPSSQVTYSSVIVEQVAYGIDNSQVGYTVTGYSNVNPFFTAQVSASAGTYQTITAGDETVSVPNQYTDNTVQIPYGYMFTNMASVVDFLLSYGVYLENQGLIFDDTYNGYTLTWVQMAREFLYFAGQGWNPGTMINLNPVATTLKAGRPISIVDTIASLTPENMLLSQYRTAIDTRNLIVRREGNKFSVTTTTGDTINFLTLRFTNYEDMIVFDNTSQYNDLIYDPTTGARQLRLSVKAQITTDWNGQLDAQGFILNLNNVKEWQTYTKYTKGEIVLYKNTYYQAMDIVQPSEEFNYNNWVKSDYQLIDQGLLPNLANKADELQTAYSIYNATLTTDQDLFAFGLIGFRPRQYMSGLNLDDVTQVQIYQQFLGTKGTRRAAELFTKADIGKESGDYKIYENWAIQAGTYGAQANKSFFEITLNEADLKYNPSTVQIINPGDTSQADQTVYVSDLWNESYPINSTNILPTIYENSRIPGALPSAGYVSLDDVDITVFNINDPTSLDQNIGIIGIGTYVWIAKVNSYNWGVYRAAETPGQLTQVSDNLNSTSIATFNRPHGLSVGDLIVIKYFNDSVNGVYRVLTTPSITTVTIAYAFTNTNQTSIAGTGIVFQLQNARVSQASDIINLPYINRLIPGERVWVDNNGQGHWEVVEKQSPFTNATDLIPGLNSSALCGSTIAQTRDNLSALVGAPGYGNGVVLSYIRDPELDYRFGETIQCTAPDTAAFGNKVVYGNQTWGAIGANLSNGGAGYVIIINRAASGNILLTQLLTAPDTEDPIEFGSALAMSTNERWLYIGAPSTNTVYAYSRVDVENQSVTYPADGSTTVFNWSDAIQIDYNYPQQLTVKVGNFYAAEGVDYQVTATSVVFATAPGPNLDLVIARAQSAQLDDTTYYNVAPSSTTGFGFSAQFNVQNARGSYTVTLAKSGINYQVGDTMVLSYTDVDPTGSSANNITITVTAVSLGAIQNFTYSGVGVGTQSTFALNELLYNATDYANFTVTVNDQLLRPVFDYTFDTATTEITFIDNPPVGADIIVTAGTYWDYVTTITNPASLSGDNFGFALSTTSTSSQLIVGAPDVDVNAINQVGTSYVYDKSTVRYIVSNAAQTTYTIPGTITNPVYVTVNNTLLLSTAQSIQGQYSISGNTLTFTNITFTVGDIIDVETNQFTLIQEILPTTPSVGGLAGYEVEICAQDCSIYAGAPGDSTTLIEAGSVDRSVNQSKLYGVTTSTIANPILTSSGTLRINNMVVTLPAAPNNTVEGLVTAINQSGIPNVVAAATPNLEFRGDGSTQTFDIGNLYTLAASYTAVVYVNDVLQQDGYQYTYNPSTEQINFINAPLSGTLITVVSGRITITVQNRLAAAPANLLTVLPGPTNSLFDQLGFETFAFAQQLTSPAPVAYAKFGTSVSVDTTATNLVIGAPNGNVYEPTTFDAGQTYFDQRSTTFYNPVLNGGVAYTYDYFPSATQNVNNPGKFAFGQQIYSTQVQQGDQFGLAANYTSGRLLVGAVGSSILNDSAFVSVFRNYDNVPAWTVIRRQQPVANVQLLNGVFAYNKLLNSSQTYFDFINPLQGKILGVAQRNIDYIGAVDPAQYNTGTIHNNGNQWGSEHIGQIWWDTDTVRFIDPNQDDLQYTARKWGATFPGSSVDIYQWIESNVTPANYTGTGTPLSNTSYTISSQLGSNNLFETRYYYWVRGITSIASGAGKTLSANGVANYITDPRNSGIPYIAAIDANTIALYNFKNTVSAQTTVLSISFDRKITGADIHTEYDLIADGIADAFLNDSLYRKMQDSLCGTDTAGNNVPDPMLSEGMKYGVQFRPRQSMFNDRFAALKNYLGRANTVLAQYPIVESRSFNLLNKAEPTPPAYETVNSVTVTNWNFEVANLETLNYQNLTVVPVGYKYLVLSDSSQDGRWTIYTVIAPTPTTKALMLSKVQSYDTPLYWYYTNWYLPGYNSTTAPKAAVANYAGLETLSYKTVPVGASARVTNNGFGKYEIYLRTGLNPATDWTRVGLEDGTIQFKEELWDYQVGGFGFDTEVFDAQYFDEAPTTETRYIIQALNEEIYVDELLYERNSSLMLLFNVIYNEFTNPAWLIKTSLVDVTHNIRTLQPYQTYIQDNQTFVLDYFNEVKPYHVVVRQFNLIYTGLDTFDGTLTDYDVPAYYNTALEVPQFVSPILTPYTHAETAVHQSTASDADSSAQVWLEQPWTEWYNNYLLNLQAVVVAVNGTGYTVPPAVEVSGNFAVAPVLTAQINSAGQVIAINIVSYGSGYTTTPIITLVGGNGTGAQAVAVMGNNLVRSLKTVIKYDRYQYQTTVVPWDIAVSYPNGTLVRYRDQVWTANYPLGAAVPAGQFNFDYWTLVNPEFLSGVDRTMGLYVPTVNEPGLSLPLLINGVEYPGVKVTGVPFSDDTGFDRGTFDTTPYDNLFYGPGGIPTYSPSLLDARYASYWGVDGVKVPTGTAQSDINVDGGGYVDTYSSHAPEELVPGAMFDTLDMRVYTAPGADWELDGHGFPEAELRFEYNSADPTYSFAGALPYPVTVMLTNETIKADLHLGTDYTVDWSTQTITMLPAGGNLSEGDIIGVFVYELGGGNQLFKGIYSGSDVVANKLTVPVAYYNADRSDAIQEFAIFVNGTPVAPTDYIYAPQFSGTGISTSYNPDASLGTTLSVTSTAGVRVGYQVTGQGFISGQIVVEVVNATSVIISAVPDGTPGSIVTFIPTINSTEITFGAWVLTNPTDFISITAIGPTIINDVTTNYSWSVPLQQYIVGEPATYTYALTNSLEYNNAVNAVVTVGGIRLRTAAGIEYVSDGVTTTYTVAQRLGIDQSTIASNEVFVYIDDVLLTYGYTVTPDAAGTYVTFDFAQITGSTISIYVTTGSQAYIDTATDELVITDTLVNTDTEIVVTTWNDTRQQQLLTKVYVGPVVEGTTITEGFDTSPYDQADLNNDPGSFDYTAVPSTFTGDTTVDSPIIDNVSSFAGLIIGSLITGAGIPDNTTISSIDEPAGTITLTKNATATAVGVTLNYGITYVENELLLGRTVTDPARLWVSLNGAWLAPGLDYTVSSAAEAGEEYETGSIIVLPSILSPSDVVMITMYTESVVPEAMAFRIFQDMRGVQSTYRITPATTTYLVQDVSTTDDVIYVDNAGALPTTQSTATSFGTGDGITRQFDLQNSAVLTVDEVYIDSVLQSASTYNVSIARSTVIFNTAPADGANINFVMTVFDGFGVVTIDGERIMYRDIDTVNTPNSISSLLRGTAGTAIAAHYANTVVYDMSENNLLPAAYQNTVVETTTLATGSETVFVAPNIILD